MFTKIVSALSLSVLCLFGTYNTAHASQIMNVSAYVATGNPMANGEYPYEGAVASDDLPFGTRLLIAGREYVVKDRFGGGYTDRIDIFMDSYEDAINFGRQYLPVEIIG